MKLIHQIVFLAALISAPLVAWSEDCATLMAEIDQILESKPDLDEETIIDEDNVKNVKQLRIEGETLHTDGKQEECMAVLSKALELLKNEV